MKVKRNLLRVLITALCLSIVATFAVGCGEGESTFSVDDQKASDGLITVEYSIHKSDAKKYDSIKANVYHDDDNGRLLFSTELDKTKNQADVQTSYGKLKIDLVGVKGEVTEVIKTDKASVWADSYNLASLNGSFPVVYFTLDLFSMQNGVKDAFAGNANLPIMNDAPTFVALERVSAYDWTALPQNVFSYPNVPLSTAIGGDFHQMNVHIAEYIKELYQVNNSSTFHFYCVDNYCELILKFFTAQGIPDSNFNATFISDGTGSVASFKPEFANTETAESNYTAMVSEWQRIKNSASDGDTDYLDNVLNGSGTMVSVLHKYPIVIASTESNVDWWCSRDLFSENTDSDYIKGVLTQMKTDKKLKIFGINDMLKLLNDQTPDNVEDNKDYMERTSNELKTLFHFDTEMFSAAEQEGKKVLMIVGTSIANETNFETYLKMLKKIYGDEYKIYYKGHPKYPTGLNQEKSDLFDSLGIIDLDASIAAELILFYCPDIYLTGYQSTTFKSAQSGKFLAMFNHSKESGSNVATTDGYGDMPDCYLKPDDSGDYVVIEYQDGSATKYYDIANDQIIDQLP